MVGLVQVEKTTSYILANRSPLHSGIKAGHRTLAMMFFDPSTTTCEALH
jgi:hypothetical protein